jgi:hypothetical protein
VTEKDFILQWAKKHADSIKTFPDDFVTDGEMINIPLPGQRLNMGEELFGTFGIIDNTGHTIHTAQSLTEAKYYIYANRSNKNSLSIPKDEKVMAACVTAYEKYLDEMIKQIRKEYAKNFPEGISQHETVTQIFYQLALVRF